MPDPPRRLYAGSQFRLRKDRPGPATNRIDQQNGRLAWSSPVGCNMNDCRQALTRRRWMALSVGFLAGRGLAAEKNVNDEILDWAKHTPLSMQFRGGSAGWKRRLPKLSSQSQRSGSRPSGI